MIFIDFFTPTGKRYREHGGMARPKANVPSSNTRTQGYRDTGPQGHRDNAPIAKVNLPEADVNLPEADVNVPEANVNLPL